MNDNGDFMNKDIIRVLLVEDNPVDAELVDAVIGSLGKDIALKARAESLREALDLLSEEEFDLILLDLSLPDSESENTVSTVLEQVPAMPVVVLSGTKDEDLAVGAVASGAQDYLVKGETPAGTLIRAIRYAVERKALQDRLVNMESRIQHIRKMDSLGHLAGGVAHHLNNILLGISGNVELVQMSKGLDEEHQKRLNAISDLTHRASDLSKQMLACSGWTGTSVGLININDLIEGMRPIIDVMVGKHIDLDVRLNDSSVWQRGDEGIFREIILNILINSVEAIGRDNEGEIIIETGFRSLGEDQLEECVLTDAPEPGDFACLRISDTGCGIEQEIMEMIFDPFFSTKFMGRGLGLASVRAQVRSMKGTIRVSSTPGEGTVMTVFFPALEPSSASTGVS